MEQMSIFELEKICSNIGSAIGKVKEDTYTDETNYLQKGEKILTLLRNKKRKEFKPSGFFEAINLRSYKSKKSIRGKLEYLISIARKVIRYQWKKASEDNNPSIQTFLGFSDVIITRMDDMHEASKIIKNLLERRKKKYEGTYEIKKGEEVYYVPQGDAQLTESQCLKGYKLKYSHTYYGVTNIGKYFEESYFIDSLRKRVQIELNEHNAEQLKDNLVADFIFSKLKANLEEYTNDSGKVTMRKLLLDIPFIQKYFTDNDIEVETQGDKKMNISDLFPLWLMSDAPYRRDLIACNGKFIHELFELLIDVYIGDKQTDSFLKEIAVEYARVYQTKKAIPDKVIKAMKESGFNKYFGYVEFDEECDLKSINEIEKEFRALQLEIFHQNSKKEEVSLRFRKLGRHHASGLYFPTLKCLCVDVRSPSSMAHEYGHMLDYENGDISKGVKFSSVRMLYRQLLEDYIFMLPKDDPLKLRWNGNTKYNKAYYMEPTEIFARSLEIYLVRYMKIDNSLVKPEGGFAYPEDTKLLDAIVSYFNDFFEVMPVAKKAAAGK